MEPSSLIVSVSGIRGIVGAGLTVESALAFGAAFGSTLDGGRVLVGRDGRPSGEMLRHAVCAGLASTGCTVMDLGIVPTPTVGVSVGHFSAAGAIQITASHNPAPWNGLKMFGANGAVLSPSAGAVVKTLFESGSFRRVGWSECKLEEYSIAGSEEHLRRVLNLVPVEAIAARRFRVILDANGGAGGKLGVTLLERLGCIVIPLGATQDGLFRHEPEPIPAHLSEVAPLIAREQADLACVLDPDADRLALIDERGRCLSEELTLALAVQYRLRSGRGPVVVNMSTSRVIADIAQGADCELHRSAVGEANVVERMQATSALIGGEGNGGVIDPRVGWVRDPFIGMAMILALLTETGSTLGAAADRLPAYAMLKTKRELAPSLLPALYARLVETFPEASADRLDGLRLDWPDRWLHIRPSNTEPIVRVIAEAPTEAEAHALCAVV